MKRMIGLLSRSSRDFDTDDFDAVSNKKPITCDVCANCGNGWWRDDSSCSTTEEESSLLPLACCCGLVHYCSPACKEAHGHKHSERCKRLNGKVSVSESLSNDVHMVAFAAKRISIKAYGNATTDFADSKENTKVKNIIIEDVLPKLVASRHEGAKQMKYIREDCKRVLPKCKKLIDELFVSWDKCRANPDFPALEDHQLLEVLQQRVEDEQLISKAIHHQSLMVADKATGGRVGALDEKVRDRVLRNTFKALVQQLQTMTNIERDSFMFKLMFDDSLENVMAALDESGLTKVLLKSDPMFSQLYAQPGATASSSSSDTSETAETIPSTKSKPKKDKSAKEKSSKEKSSKSKKSGKAKKKKGKEDS